MRTVEELIDVVRQLNDLMRHSHLNSIETKSVLRAFIRDSWPDLAPWSTLSKPVIEEVQTASVGAGIVVTFEENGIPYIVLAEAGDHYSWLKTQPSYMIPGGFINLTKTPGSSRVPASILPENARIGAAREIEEEYRGVDPATGTSTPLLEVEPERLTLIDTDTLAFKSGEKRIVMGLMLQLAAQEVIALKSEVAHRAADPAYKAAAAAATINKESGKPEVADIKIFPLDYAAEGNLSLVHPDQLSLFRLANARFKSQHASPT